MNVDAPGPVRRPRVGIIGISGYGRIHLELAREQAAAGAIELVGAAVINAREEAATVRELEAAGCRCHPSHEAMLAEERGRLDLCLIPTGIGWHRRMTLAALEAGANVLVEKPLAGSMEDAEAMVAAGRAADRFVAVGFQDVYSPEAQRLKRELVAGAVGRIRSVRFLGLWPRPPSYFSRNPWAGRLAAEGAAVLDSPLNNAFAHFVNLALFLAGPAFVRSAEATEVEATLWRTNDIESFDTGVVRARTEEGAELWFGASHATARTREPEIVIDGEEGRAVWRHERDWAVERRGFPVAGGALPPTSVTRRAMMGAVARRIRESTTFVCDAALASRHTALIVRTHAAAAIVPAPGGWRLVRDGGLTEAVRSVPGLEALLEDAFARGELPEAAAPGSRVA
jgi:predicted dehydrogenase